MKIRFGINPRSLQAFINGDEVLYYGVTWNEYDHMIVECDHGDIITIRQDINDSTLRRNIPKKSAG